MAMPCQRNDVETLKWWLTLATTFLLACLFRAFSAIPTARKSLQAPHFFDLIFPLYLGEITTVPCQDCHIFM